VAPRRALSARRVHRDHLARPAERIVAFYNQRGTAAQWIKEGKRAIKWTRLSCYTFAANYAVRLQLYALAYNLGNFMRTLTMPKTVADQPAREADRDRRHGRQPWPLCDVPAGRSRGVAADVRRNPFADRSTAGTRASMSGAGVKFDRRQRQWCALMQARQGLSPLQYSQPTDGPAARAMRDIPLPKTPERDDHGPTTHGESEECRSI
jgi:hypothetical protein